MSTLDKDKIRQRLAAEADAALVAMLTIESGGYRTDVLEMAEAELARRGMSQDRLAEFSAYRRTQNAPRPPEETIAAGERHMNRGGMWATGGVLLTAASFVLAPPGGTFVLAWGAIIFGIAQYFHGYELKKKAIRTQADSSQAVEASQV